MAKNPSEVTSKTIKNNSFIKMKEDIILGRVDNHYWVSDDYYQTSFTREDFINSPRECSLGEFALEWLNGFAYDCQYAGA